MRNRASEAAFWGKWALVLGVLLAIMPGSLALADWQITAYDGTDEDPCIAWNGNHYLVAWSRSRNDTNFVYGRRVTSSREFVDDEIPIWDPVLSSSPGGATYPRAAASGGDGSKWLVVWRNEYGGVMEILGRFISADGTPDASVLTIGTTNYFSPVPVIAWNGFQWLVVWEGYETYRYIQGRFVYTNGAMGSVFDIDKEAGIQKYRARVGALGSDFFVAWMDNGEGAYNICGKKVDVGGNLTARLVVHRCEGSDYTNTASGGSSYFLVTWRCLGSAGNAHIWGRRVNAAGTATVGTEIEISSDQINNSGAAAWTGSYFKVAYDLTSQGPYYRPVYEDGSMGSETDLSTLLSTGAGTYVANAQGDTNCLCVWEANVGNREIFADGIGEITVIPAGGAPSRCFLAPNTPNPFNPVTTIRFGIPEGRHVLLAIHDVCGRQVSILEDAPRTAGEFVRTWDGRDESGREVGSGIYFARMVAGEYTATRKIVLLR
ncbi:MAG: T9SS type A sorting domain-containing protein [Candidatus Eisenbacteria bacterium]